MVDAWFRSSVPVMLAWMVVAGWASGQVCPVPSVFRSADITSAPTQAGLQMNSTIAVRAGQSPGDALAFFLAYSVDDPPGGGRAIWQSDGTAAGTRRYSPVLNVLTTSGVFPAATTTAVYFSASDGLYQATAERVVQIEATFNERPSATLGEHLVYALSTGVYSVRADALSPSGFVREQLVAPPADSPGLAARQFVQFAGEIYFTVSRLPTAHGGTIYATDGTAAGTRVVRDFPTLGNSGAPAPSQLYVFGQRMYFSAYDDIAGQELWSTDGTPAGTTRFRDFHTTGSSSPAILGAAGGKLYVRAVIDYAPPQLDTFLIAISPDGTYTTWTGALGARGVVPADGFSEKLVLDVGGKALFIAKSPFTTQSYDLWATDGSGTFQGTQRLTTNLLQYDGANEVIGVSVASGSRAVIRVQPSPSFVARELWVTDGQGPGTVRALTSFQLGYENQATNSQHLVSDGQVAHFVAPGGGGGFIGDEPWVSDGTQTGTALLKDLREDGSSSPAQPCVLSPGRVLFAAYGTGVNVELFASNGTSAGTGLVKDIALGTNSSTPIAILPLGSRAAAVMDSRGTGPRPYLWDGSAGAVDRPLTRTDSPWFGAATSGGTFMVAWNTYFINAETGQVSLLTNIPGSTVRSGFSPSYPISPGARLGNGIVISGTTTNVTPQVAAEPAFIGPTVQSCRIIRDLTPGGALSYPQGFTALNGGVLFFANANSVGIEPWFTDGTSAGTVFLGDLNPPLAGSTTGFNPSSWPIFGVAGTTVDGPTVWNGRAYFPARVDLTSTQFAVRLGTTDGTPAGTSTVDLGVQVSGRFMAASDQGVFFVGSPTLGTTSDTELYLTQGSAATTTRVIDLTPGTVGSTWNWLVSAGDRVYFSVGSTSTQVRGVYVSDGTSTTRIDWPIAGETPTILIPMGTVRGEFIYAGRVSESIPWTIVRTRGVTSGTVSTCIAASGLTQLFTPNSNMPGQGVAVSTPSRLFFLASEPVLLYEPRAIDLCPADFNNTGSNPDVQDIFDFLNAWFASDRRADADAGGTLEPADLFTFLNAWFVGC